MKFHASYKPFYHYVFVEIIILWMLKIIHNSFCKIGFYKRHFPKYSFDILQFIFCLCEHTFMSAWNSVFFPSVPPSICRFYQRICLFFYLKCSLHLEVKCPTLFLQGHCKRINNTNYTTNTLLYIQMLFRY